MVTALELLSRTRLGIPNPPAILVLIVVFSAFIGGLPSGLVTAVIAWLYFAFFFSIPGQPFHYTGENLLRVTVWAVTTPGMAFMVGSLKLQTARALGLSKESEALAQQLVERERSERVLRESESRYRSLFDGVPVGLLRTSPEGRILDANPALVEMFGFPNRDALLGTNINDLYVDPQERQEALAEADRKGSVTSIELRLHRSDGTPIWVRASGRAVRDASGRVVQYEGAMLDVTARKQAENEVHALNRELENRVQERTAQLEAANQELEAFAYTAAHDLRAPLITLGGVSQMLLEDYAADLREEGRRHLRQIGESTRHMGALIDDLLSFSRLSRQPVHDQVIAPADLARKVLRTLNGEGTGRQIAVRIGGLPVCRADPALLKQVFVNLLSNALKFTRHREGAAIEVGGHPTSDDPTRNTYFVKDNGVGFDMQYAAKLFGVFQRLHRADEYEGTGVGLAIVQRIIHRHGGRIWAEGAPGKGATFYFTLPRSDER